MPEVGFEPTSLAALGPKPSVSANFTTPAHKCTITQKRPRVYWVKATYLDI